MSESVRSNKSRSTLVRAAGEVIRSRGLHGTRVREIARAAQMSPGSVLYHYPDNEDLILEVHRSAVSGYLTGRRKAQSCHTDPRRRLIASVEAGVPPFAQEDVIRLLFELQGLAARDDRHADLMTELWVGEKELYESVIADGVEAGHFFLRRQVDDIAATILAAEDGLALHLVSNNNRITGARAVELVVRLASSELSCPELTQMIEA